MAKRQVCVGNLPPKTNVIGMKNFNEPQVLGFGRIAWGWFVTDRQLSSDELYDYDILSEDLVEGENKQEICDALCETLKLTRGYYDIQKIEYDYMKGEVSIKFANGTKTANVFGDSGEAMIRDIIDAIR